MDHKVWRAYCSECESVTDMKRINSQEAHCTECDRDVKLTQNPVVLKQIQMLEIENEGLFSRLMINRERVAKLTLTLNPVEQEATPKWHRGDISHECRECGRATKSFYGTTPRCYPQCKPRTGKLRVDELSEEVQNLLRGLTDGGNDDDVEYIKKGG